MSKHNSSRGNEVFLLLTIFALKCGALCSSILNGKLRTQKRSTHALKCGTITFLSMRCFPRSFFSRSRRGEQGLQEAILELLIVSFFIALVFMIANRASDDVTTEKDTIAQNVGRLVSVLSYVPDVVNVQVSQSLLKDARVSVVADGSQSALLTQVTTIDSPIPVGKKGFKKRGSTVSVSGDIPMTGGIPLTISSGDGSVKNGEGSADAVVGCASSGILPRLFLVAERPFEERAKALGSISEVFVGGVEGVQIVDSVKEHIDFRPDSYLLFLSAGSGVEIKMNPHSVNSDSALKIACTMKKNLDAEGIPAKISYVQATDNELVVLPASRMGFVLSLNPGITNDDFNSVMRAFSGSSSGGAS